MFGSLGVTEILFILALALLIFGPKRLPEVGRTLGKAMGEFRRATNDLKRSFDNEMRVEDEPRRPAIAAAIEPQVRVGPPGFGVGPPEPSPVPAEPDTVSAAPEDPSAPTAR